ncbi:hypothetical protein NDU88_008831 [Pleurodeles waltl]|uniref:Uncharacterized protein n=1 Tax=Pleurodeles waltl TaxID=8319 RepID=A0AAV7N7U2_PLEWA|nr:hypothetical protein NDU88_008831 [Pleurodeles waltl]
MATHAICSRAGYPWGTGSAAKPTLRTADGHVKLGWHPMGRWLSCQPHAAHSWWPCADGLAPHGAVALLPSQRCAQLMAMCSWAGTPWGGGSAEKPTVRTADVHVQLDWLPVGRWLCCQPLLCTVKELGQ